MALKQKYEEIDAKGMRATIDPSYPEKIMTIKLPDRHTPHYDIKGDWAGKDIMIIVRTLGRAYRLLQRQRRRTLEQEVSQPETVMSAKGE